MQFTVESVFSEDAAILRCYGSVSSPEALALSHAVAPLMFERSAVVLDFSGVEAIDSGGLGTLALLHSYVCSSGGRLRYCCLNARVADAFERTRLSAVFDVYGSEEEALQVG